MRLADFDADRIKSINQGGWIDISDIGPIIEMMAHVRIKMRVNDLSLQAFAQRCGLPESQVEAYLNGTEEPSVKNLTKLATGVGCVWRLATEAEAIR